MSEDQTSLVSIECAPGTNELIVEALRSVSQAPQFFHHKERLPHARPAKTILDELFRKSKSKARVMSLQQVTTCLSLGVFEKEFQNWCWVKFPDGDPFFLSFLLIKRANAEIWIVDEVAKRGDLYSPFGCHLIYEGFVKQEEVKERALPPEENIKKLRR